MVLRPVAYLRHMEGRGLWHPQAPMPEQNSAVFSAFLALFAEHIGGEPVEAVVLSPGGLGLAVDRLDGSGHYGWALLGPISHPPLPFTATSLLAELPALTAALWAFDPQARVSTDTFQLRAPPNAAEARCFGWLHSPVADLRGGEAAWWASLAKKRRQRLSQGLSPANMKRVRLDWSTRPPDAVELEFAARLCRRWGEGADYALAQTLWPLAVARVLPAAVRFLRVYVDGALTYLHSYVLRGPVALSTAALRDPARSLDGLGTALDRLAIGQLCAEGGVEFLDPTCRTGLDDPGAIGLSKRAVVNRDAIHPLLRLGDPGDPRLPFLDRDGRWRIPPEPHAEGAPP